MIFLTISTMIGENNEIKEVIKLKEEKLTKVGINWLACIYDDYHLNLYKMGLSKKWDLASFNKKRRKIIKNSLKYTHFWEELEYWLVICRHILY